jgi:glucose/arabinose dehydrogenase
MQDNLETAVKFLPRPRQRGLSRWITGSGLHRPEWLPSSPALTPACYKCRAACEATRSGHITRTILFANGKLYVSVGSSCNVCVETDPRRSAVSQMSEDGSDAHICASGLRNALGLAVDERTGTVWVTDNSHDRLGDDLPPDEIDDLGHNGGDSGWRYCYGSRVPNTSFGGTKERCHNTVPPRLELQAHSAPLGLAFYKGEMFPSPISRRPVCGVPWILEPQRGYKIIRVKINELGEPAGVEDFITGWLPPGESRRYKWMGRPVGLAIGPDGSLYISDDGSGSIYRVLGKKK